MVELIVTYGGTKIYLSILLIISITIKCLQKIAPYFIELSSMKHIARIGLQTNVDAFQQKPSLKIGILVQDLHLVKIKLMACTQMMKRQSSIILFILFYSFKQISLITCCHMFSNPGL
mmetsp:Transcript_17080/g.22558  ORF Transcript_17080/g.22558 Transcript_17080/m.22558 type:complete len:118 (+) Transcript_17080:143-496(+)